MIFICPRYGKWAYLVHNNNPRVELDRMATEKRSSFLLDLRDLHNGFDAVDTEGKGYIDFDGLQLMIAGMKGLDGSMAQELMDSLDRNKDGKVTFEDFQTLFTLQRDEVKHQLGRSEESTDSAVYVTALPSPDASPFSPDRPPIPPGQKPKRKDSKGSVLQVPESPDLTAHARSLKGSILHSPQLGPRTLSLSSIESGDLLLEDVGGIGDMPPSPSLPGSAKMAASSTRSKSEGLRLIYNELVACCPTGVTNREGVVQLCERLRYDPLDTQEMLDIWQELEDQAPRHVTIEMLCHNLREKETEPATGTIVTSTPAVGTSQQARKWQEEPLKLSESFGAPIVHPPLETSPKQQTQQQVEELAGNNFSEMTTEEKSLDETTEFPFQDYSLHLNTASKEGSRLSRGPLSESSLIRPVASIAAIQKLQQELSQLSQERDSLKLNLSRVEEEKKMLIKEGDEGFVQLVREKDDKLRKIEEEHKTKRKEMESSFTEERQQIEEKAQCQIATLKSKLLSMKSDEERMKGELEHYIEQKEWLDKELDCVREELVNKNKKIELLQQTLDEKSEGGSEVDFLAQAARMQELESDRLTYTELNEDLLESQRELRDKVDELKAENEQLKQKVIGEKRKRQRKKSASGTRQPSGTRGKQKQGSEKGRKGSRGLPSTLSEDLEIEEREVIKIVDEDMAVEPVLSGSEASEVFSDSDDEMVARSSASLMEELQMENQRAVIGQKLEDLISQRSILETSCNDLRSQLNNLKENKAALRQQIEQELRKKMYQHANLDKHIKHLSQLKATLASARQAFSSQLQDSEQYLTQYLEGLETDINQFISEDAELSMAHREDDILSQRVKDLEEELELTKINAELTRKEVQALKEACIVQQANLANAEEENEALLAQHNTELAKVHHGHSEEVENLNRALRKETTALEELQEQAQAQKSESERALSRLSSSVNILEAEKKLIEVQHAAEIQKMEEAMATEKAELEKQLGVSLQELQLLHEAKQELESTNIDLHSKIVLLQEEYSKMEEHSEEQVLLLQQQLMNLKENRTRDLEVKIDAQERQLKTLQAELALAIHDLTAKEQECWELQEKVDQIEEGLNDSEIEQLTQDLENLRDQRHELQNQLKSSEEQLVEGREQLLKENQENAQLKLTRDQLNDDLARAIDEANTLREQLQKKEEEALKRKDEQSDGEESPDSVILNAVPIVEPVLQEVKVQESFEISLPSSFLHDQSVNNSYSSQETTQHEEIVKQMKSQLEELQGILIGRHLDDSTSSEISLVQELLASNQSLLAQLRRKQHNEQQHNEPHLLATIPKGSEMVASLLGPLSAELVDKVDQLSCRITAAATTVSQVQFTLEERDARHMSALDGLLESSIAPIDANLEDVDSSPSKAEKTIEVLEMEKEVETLKAEKVHLENTLAEQSLAMNQKLVEAERKISLQEEIIQRMKLEMEKLNFHLGKAKSLQNHYDDDRLERSKQLEDKEREILNKSHEIEQLREEVRKVCSPQLQVDTSNQLLESHEAELLMQQESLQAAEELISTMRYHLNDLYQVLINPSDSSTYDVLEVTELFQHIRDAVETLKANVTQEEEARQEAEESLKQKTEDYDLLYSEHEDEVMAVLQQKQQLQLLLEDLQGRYQNLMSVYDEQAHEQTQLLDLQKQRNVLIDLVQTLSLQAVSSFI